MARLPNGPKFVRFEFRSEQRAIRGAPFGRVSCKLNVLIMLDQPIEVYVVLAVGITTMAGPFVLPGLFHHPGSHGIHFDVPHEL